MYIECLFQTVLRIVGEGFLWKGGRFQIFGNNLNKSKFYSGRN